MGEVQLSEEIVPRMQVANLTAVMPWNYDVGFDEELGCPLAWSMRCVDLLKDPTLKARTAAKRRAWEAEEAAKPI